MVKGYEFAKDQYVIFTPEELKAMEEAGTHMAEITEFVPLEAVDPVYFDKAYYLAPDKGGAKPYALLASALRESKRCALGRWAARGKQYIVMIRPVEDGLVMQQLLYAGEVRSMKELEIPKTEVKPAELKLAQQLIEQQTSETFDPSHTPTRWPTRIEAAVQKKVEGQEITLAEAPEGGGAQVIDLMEALRASLEKKAAAPRARRRPQPAAAARKPPKRAQAAEAAGAGGAQGGQEKRLAAAAATSMHPYGVRDVEKLLRLPRSTIRALIAAGLRRAGARAARRVAVLLPGPDRAAHRAGARRRERAAAADHALDARTAPPPARRRCRCPGSRIGAVADRVVVREGGSRWQAESGQYLLEFEGDPADGSLERDRAPSVDAGERQRRAGVVRARGRRSSARTPTRRSTPTSAPSPPIRRSLDARINLGRLLHEAGRLASAERVYRDARSRPAATIRCCSTTSACCSTTWIAAPRRSRPTRRRCAAIPTSPTATTTWRCSTRARPAEDRRFATWRAIAPSLRPARNSAGGTASGPRHSQRIFLNQA